MPDALWALVEPVIPPAKTRPQGGGMSRVDDRAVFTAIVFVLTSAAARGGIYHPISGSQCPPPTGGSPSGPRPACGGDYTKRSWMNWGSRGLIDWSRAVLDAASVRAKKGAH